MTEVKPGDSTNEQAEHQDTMRYTPVDWAAPDWFNTGRVHEWKNYVSEEVQAMWGTFTDAQKQALARQSEENASREEWD